MVVIRNKLCQVMAVPAPVLAHAPVLAPTPELVAPSYMSTGYAETVDPVEAGEGIFHGIRRNRRSRGSRQGDIPRDAQKPPIPWKPARESSMVYARTVDPVEAWEQIFHGIRRNRQFRGNQRMLHPRYLQNFPYRGCRLAESPRYPRICPYHGNQRRIDP